MPRDAPIALADQLAAAQQWWREAGVEHHFADEAASWLSETADAAPEAPPATPDEPPEPPPPAIGGDPAGWPCDLAGFAAWWTSEPSLAAGGVSLRVPPRGPAGARLMALVPEPEAADREHLLSGSHGELLASFLGNAGVALEEVYFAAALPRHTPMPDWRNLKKQGLGEVVRHHIGLVRPERLILFGQDVIALLGIDIPRNPHFLLNLNQDEGSVRTLAARSLDHMLRVPQARKRLWQDWLDWTDG